jgi:serpin B
MTNIRFLPLALLAAFGLVGCSSETVPVDTNGPLAPAPDAGGSDVSSQPDADASLEAAAVETSQPDTGSPGADARPEAASPDGASPEAASPDAGPTAAKSDLARDTNPAVAAGDKTALSDGMSAFAFDLFGKVNDASAQAKNFVCSPASVSLALGMTYAGAAGNTAAQFRSVLHITQDPATYFKSLDWLTLALGGRADEALAAKTTAGGPAQDPAEYRMHVVNSIWGDKTLAFQKPFLDTLASSFGAGVYLADFMNQPEAERQRINAWVSQETLDKINGLLPQRSITAATRTVLVNALHLKLPWGSPFATAETSQSPFALGGGTLVNVPFMHQHNNFPYAEDAAAQAVAVPLAGWSLYLVLLVPKTGTSLAGLEGASLTTEVKALTTAAFAKPTYLSLLLPRFKFTIDSTSVAGPLKALGLVDAFTQAADFSGMAMPEKLAFDDVFHKAMIGAKETGLEAAAATAVVIAPPGMPPPIAAEVIADHPFFFGIYDKPTATWLFLGHVVDPSQGDPL